MRDLLLYVVIAVGVLASAWMYGVHQAATSTTVELPVKWIGFAGMTVLMLWYIISAARRLWKIPTFWATLVVFGVVHLVAGILVLRNVGQVPLMLYPAVVVPEFLCAAACLDLIFPDSHK